MLTLNRQSSVEFFLGPRVLHHRLHRDHCLSWRHVCLRLTLGKRVGEQRSRAAYSSGLSLRMMFCWKSIASSGFGSFDSSFGLLNVSFFFFALCPRDAIANNNFNLTILTFQHHSSLTSNMSTHASRVSQMMLREYSSSPEP